MLVEVGVETDFVSRSEPFREFTHDLAMQVAASNPLWVRRDEVPDDVVEREKAIYREQAKGKPENVDREDARRQARTSSSRRSASWSRPSSRTPTAPIEQLRTDLVGVIGENVEVRRFVRFQLGETAED